MKIKKGFILREVAGENVVIAVGEEARSFSAMIRLNSTGATIWRALEKGADMNGLTDAVLEKFDTDRDTAENDIAAFVDVVRKAGLLEE